MENKHTGKLRSPEKPEIIEHLAYGRAEKAAAKLLETLKQYPQAKITIEPSALSPGKVYWCLHYENIIMGYPSHAAVSTLTLQGYLVPTSYGRRFIDVDKSGGKKERC